MAALVGKFLIISGKALLLFLLFYCFASQIDSSAFISYETSSAFSTWLYGFSSQDNFDDLWFFSDFGFSLLSATLIFKVIILLVRKCADKARLMGWF